MTRSSRCRRGCSRPLTDGRSGSRTYTAATTSPRPTGRPAWSCTPTCAAARRPRPRCSSAPSSTSQLRAAAWSCSGSSSPKLVTTRLQRAPGSGTSAISSSSASRSPWPSRRRGRPGSRCGPSFPGRTTTCGWLSTTGRSPTTRSRAVGCGRPSSGAWRSRGSTRRGSCSPSTPTGWPGPAGPRSTRRPTPNLSWARSS